MTLKVTGSIIAAIAQGNGSNVLTSINIFRYPFYWCLTLETLPSNSAHSLIIKYWLQQWQQSVIGILKPLSHLITSDRTGAKIPMHWVLGPLSRLDLHQRTARRTESLPMARFSSLEKQQHHRWLVQFTGLGLLVFKPLRRLFALLKSRETANLLRSDAACYFYS